jgi:hypothetical protein
MLDWYKTSGASPTPTTSISSEASLPKAAEQSVSATNTPQDHGEYLRRQLLNQVVDLPENRRGSWQYSAPAFVVDG